MNKQDKLEKHQLAIFLSLSDIEIIQGGIADTLLGYNISSEAEKSLNQVSEQLDKLTTKLENYYEVQQTSLLDTAECDHCGASTIMCSCDWRGLK